MRLNGLLRVDDLLMCGKSEETLLRNVEGAESNCRIRENECSDGMEDLFAKSLWMEGNWRMFRSLSTWDLC